MAAISRRDEGGVGKPLAEMEPREIVVWMNQPSHYQTAFFREIARRPQVRLSVFYADDLAADRKSLGWAPLKMEAYGQSVLCGPRRTGKALREAWRRRHAVHLVNGVWSVPIFVLCSSLLLLLGASVYFHSERTNPASSRGGPWENVKRLWVRILFLKAKGIFVIGGMAGEYFRNLGVPPEKVYPFMYFNSGSSSVKSARESGDPFTVIYAGQFVARKHVDDLICAFAKFAAERPNARLLLVGSGPLRTAYAARAAGLQITDVVEIAGPLVPLEVTGVIRRSDVLVLPSAFDGWGLTINEALQAGIPAICSDACGASELLLGNRNWGLVFPYGDVDRLVCALREIASNPDRFRPVSDEVEAAIGASALTSYFLSKVIGPPFDERLRQEAVCPDGAYK